MTYTQLLNIFSGGGGKGEFAPTICTYDYIIVENLK